MAELIPPKNLLVPAVLVFILFFGLMVFPPLGALIGVLSPFPLVFIYLQRGRQAGIALVVLVFAVLLLLVGANQAMLFLAEYALMALVMGELIRFQLPGDRCIAISALASGFVSMVLLVAMFEDHDLSIKEFFAKQKDPVLLVCETGGQSKKTSLRYRKDGVDNVFYIKGGIMEWESNSLPLSS